jgi:hypothetical protein
MTIINHTKATMVYNSNRYQSLKRDALRELHYDAMLEREPREAQRKRLRYYRLQYDELSIDAVWQLFYDIGLIEKVLGLSELNNLKNPECL